MTPAHPLSPPVHRPPGRPGCPLVRAWKRPGLPTEWTRVIEEMPADMLYPLPAGYVLLDARKDRPLRAWAAHLEFRDEPPV
jgi:hypothetical protein